jgi:hypothetical protein
MIFGGMIASTRRYSLLVWFQRLVQWTCALPVSLVTDGPGPLSWPLHSGWPGMPVACPFTRGPLSSGYGDSDRQVGWQRRPVSLSLSLQKSDTSDKRTRPVDPRH